MNFRTLFGFLRIPRLTSKLALMNDLKALSRLHFLYAAVDSGLLKALRGGSASPDRLADHLSAKRPELLGPLLDLGVSVGELSREDGIYGLKGKRSRALAEEDADAFAAYLQEAVAYHGSVYAELAARIKGAPLGDYLAATAGLVARSSRTLEPLMRGIVQDVVRACRPERLLEIGCGSGIYLLRAAEASASLTGVGIDMQEDAVVQAQRNLQTWGLSGRFSVRHADIRRDARDLGGPFDLATLYNNLYYFQREERTALFAQVHALLSPGGTVAVVSLMRGESVASRNFDIVLRSTQGCAPLPDIGETSDQLRAAGFRDIDVRQIMRSEHYAGLLARA